MPNTARTPQLTMVSTMTFDTDRAGSGSGGSAT